MSYVYPFLGVDEHTKLRVWNKGARIEGKDSTIWRKDSCGNVIKYDDHGNTFSLHGWEIDHIKPRAKGGPTTWDNLQPLYWRLNRIKSDDYPWDCSMVQP